MHHFQGISVDAGVSITGDCAITHTVSLESIEIELGHRVGSLQLCMTEDAAIKLMNIVTVALDDFRQHCATADNSDQLRSELGHENPVGGPCMSPPREM